VGRVSYHLQTKLADLCFAKEKKTKTVESEDKEWLENYGEKGQKIIRECVNANIPDYEYLKSFAMKA
jgi:hypothetical protein